MTQMLLWFSLEYVILNIRFFTQSEIFSIEVKKGKKFKNFISGGRYDELTSNLGFRKVSAAGAAVNMSVYE